MLGLKFILKVYGITQTEICNDLGFPNHFFTKWFNGTRPIPKKWSERIATYLNVSEDILLKELTKEEEREVVKNHIMKLAKDYEIDI